MGKEMKRAKTKMLKILDKRKTKMAVMKMKTVLERV